MWILISGPPGTSKHKIAEGLEREEGFQYKEWRVAVDDNLMPFTLELQYFVQHVRNQFELEKVRSTQNIVTVGSAWESFEIYAKVAHQRSDITTQEKGLLRQVYLAFMEDLKPPDAIIFMDCTDKMASFNKMLLDKREVHEETFRLTADAYGEFKARLAVPVVEVEHTNTFDHAWHTVQFGIQSLKTGGLTDNTIWKKGIFR